MRANALCEELGAGKTRARSPRAAGLGGASRGTSAGRAGTERSAGGGDPHFAPPPAAEPPCARTHGGGRAPDYQASQWGAGAGTKRAGPEVNTAT